MPRLTRPEGIEIHWEARDEGPSVVLCPHYYAFPAVYENLIEELARDHRVITYDPRGTGESTRAGPYDVATDTADLAAVLEEDGGRVVAVSWGDGSFRAIKLAVERPELVAAVVSTGGNPLLSRLDLGEIETEGLAGSESVVEAYMGMLRTDYRASLRSIVSSTNPQMSEDEVRQRVRQTAEYTSQEAAVARMRIFLEDNEARHLAPGLGGRLWVLHFETAWFPADTLERTRELLPEAHVESLTDGAISRPDLTARAVRAITGTGQPSSR